MRLQCSKQNKDLFVLFLWLCSAGQNKAHNVFIKSLVGVNKLPQSIVLNGPSFPSRWPLSSPRFILWRSPLSDSRISLALAMFSKNHLADAYKHKLHAPISSQSNICPLCSPCASAVLNLKGMRMPLCFTGNSVVFRSPFLTEPVWENRKRKTTPPTQKITVHFARLIRGGEIRPIMSDDIKDINKSWKTSDPGTVTGLSSQFICVKRGQVKCDENEMIK